MKKLSVYINDLWEYHISSNYINTFPPSRNLIESNRIASISVQLIIPEGPGISANGLGATMLGHGISVSQGVVMEAIITFLLVLVVHAVTDAKRADTKGWAPLAIGLTIAAAHMAAVPITGSSMNPARTLGPAVVEDMYLNVWVYWVGPLLGSCLAGGVYRMGLRAHREDDEGSYDFWKGCRLNRKT